MEDIQEVHIRLMDNLVSKIHVLQFVTSYIANFVAIRYYQDLGTRSLQLLAIVVLNLFVCRSLNFRIFAVCRLLPKFSHLNSLIWCV